MPWFLETIESEWHHGGLTSSHVGIGIPDRRILVTGFVSAHLSHRHLSRGIQQDLNLKSGVATNFLRRRTYALRADEKL